MTPRTPCLVLAIATLVACERRDVDPIAQPAAEQQQPVGADPAADTERDGFVLLAGNDTLAIERFARIGNELRGSLHDVQRGARLDYVAVVTDDGRIIGMHIDLVEPGAHGPTERVAVALRGDTVVVEDGGTTGDDGDRMLMPRGSTLYLNPSIALLETMLRRAENVAEGQEFSVLALDTQDDPSVIAPIVTRENGTVVIRLAEGREVRLQVDANNRIVSGENVGSAARFERIR